MTKKTSNDKKSKLTKPIESNKFEQRQKVSAVELVKSLTLLNENIESLVLIADNILEELRINTKEHNRIIKELNNLKNNNQKINNVVSNSSKSDNMPSLPPPPPVDPKEQSNYIIKEGSNKGVPEQGNNFRSSQQSSTNSGGSTNSNALSPEEAKRVLQEKLKNKKPQSTPAQSNIPIPNGQGGVIARPAKRLDGISQVGDIRESIKMDWLGESYPEG